MGGSVTVVSAVRLWRLVLAQRLPGFDPTCMFSLKLQISRGLISMGQTI